MILGQYGTYKGVYFVLVEIRGNKGILLGEDSKKKYINLVNFKPVINNKCRKVFFNGVWYLITKTKRIISLVSGKFMRWHEEHPVRQQILNTYGIQNVRNVMANHQYKLEI